MSAVVKMNALEYLSRLDNKPTLILTDPPYGMSYSTRIPGDKRWKKNTGDVKRFEVLKNDESLQDLKDVFGAAYCSLKEDGFMFVFCNDKALRAWAASAESAGFVWKDTLFWNKRCANGGDVNWPFIQVVEMILCFVKGSPITYRMYNKDGELKKRIVSLFDTGRVSKAEYCGHPTQKPLFICSQIIRGTTAEGDLVVDPYCGSGTTLFAAKELGRDYGGCDIDPAYVKIARKRLKGWYE